MLAARSVFYPGRKAGLHGSIQVERRLQGRFYECVRIDHAAKEQTLQSISEYASGGVAFFLRLSREHFCAIQMDEWNAEFCG